MHFITAHTLKNWLSEDEEIALLDIREHGQYGAEHLFFAVSIPYSILEARILSMVPRLSTRIVLYGGHAQLALVQAAAQRLEQLGYAQLHALEGGIEAWKAAGYNTFAGVNLPSKTFGELAEHVYKTPHISAQDLHALQQAPKANLIVLDGRPIEEYKKMSIPGAYCCPNGELALRAAQLAPDPETTIVINCAGRTRSIIGAQTLINLGLPNTILALENGTQGWYLVDQSLEHNADRLYPETIEPAILAKQQEKAAALSERFALRSTTVDELNTWLKDATRTVYLCDIRTAKEHQASQWPSSIRHTPGGQLVQATDEFIGTRHARIVLLDEDQVRAPAVASWLTQLGWEVYLLPTTEALGQLPTTASRPIPLQNSQIISEQQALEFLQNKPELKVFDTRPSMEFRKLHLTNSQWLNRTHAITQAAQISADMKLGTEILLIGTDKYKNKLLALELEELGYQQIFLCTVGRGFFDAPELTTSTDESILEDSECIDYLFFVHDRHQGNKEAARQYLAWETNLISQVDAQERGVFRFDS